MVLPFAFHTLSTIAPNFINKCEYSGLRDKFQIVEDLDGEQRKLVEANEALLDLEGELISVYKSLKEGYSIRFPELNTFELSPLQYAKVVLALHEGSDGIDSSLDTIKLSTCSLSNATLMIVSVTAATTKGRPFTHEEWPHIKSIAELVMKIDETKGALLKFIESRMERVAPNVTALVGVEVASQLIGAAGGILQLSRIPAGNIQVIGSGGRQHLAGLSSVSAKLHSGFIANSPLMTEISPDLFKKAERLLSAKVSIASRIDAGGECSDASYGRRLYDEIVEKLEKLSEPPPLKMIKPLPIPDSERKKRRGGKRARKLKELYAQTEMRKQKNRLAFGETAEVEVFVGDRMEGMGMLGAASGSGNLRLMSTGSNTDTRLKDHLKKHAQKKLNTTGSSGSKNGTVITADTISLSATPSIKSDQAVASNNSGRIDSNNSKYFNFNSGFRRNKD